jgi:hypothetical protein
MKALEQSRQALPTLLYYNESTLVGGRPHWAASLLDQFLSTTRTPCLSVILASGHRRHAAR